MVSELVKRVLKNSFKKFYTGLCGKVEKSLAIENRGFNGVLKNVKRKVFHRTGWVLHSIMSIACILKGCAVFYTFSTE